MRFVTVRLSAGLGGSPPALPSYLDLRSWSIWIFCFMEFLSVDGCDASYHRAGLLGMLSAAAFLKMWCDAVVAPRRLIALSNNICGVRLHRSSHHFHNIWNRIKLAESGR